MAKPTPEQEERLRQELEALERLGRLTGIFPTCSAIYHINRMLDWMAGISPTDRVKTLLPSATRPRAFIPECIYNGVLL